MRYSNDISIVLYSADNDWLSMTVTYVLWPSYWYCPDDLHIYCLTDIIIIILFIIISQYFGVQCLLRYEMQYSIYYWSSIEVLILWSLIFLPVFLPMIEMYDD